MRPFPILPASVAFLFIAAGAATAANPSANAATDDELLVEDTEGQSDLVGMRGTTDEDVAEIDTADIFGFTEGSDAGSQGLRALYHEAVGRLSRRGSGFGGLRGTMGLAYAPADRLIVSVGALADYERAREDADPTDLRGSLDFGAELAVKYQLVSRDGAGVGVAVQVSPYFQVGSDAGGDFSETLGAELRLIADAALVPNTLFGAVNIAYLPETGDLNGDEEWRASTFEAAAALSAQVADGLFVGAETRYVTIHEGFFFDDFAGWALYVGPTAYLALSELAYVGASWNFQVAGEAEAEPGLDLDLVNFERHQFRVKSGVVF